MTDTDHWTEGYFAVADGTKLHYAEMGEGTPVVLIHGAGGSAVGNWFINGIAPALAPTNRVIGIDMRGHGLSEAGPEGGLRYMATDVIEYLDREGIDRAHIGGYSMGGFVTARILAKDPSRFITASFGGSGLPESEEWAAKVPADAKGAAPDEAAAQKVFRSNRAVPGQEVGNNPRGLPELTPEARASFVAFQRKLADRIDWSAVTFPVIAINGEYDQPYAKTHRLWRELTNFTNVVLPGKGHLSAVMKDFIPRQYIDAMVAFITSNNP